jgi:hypothetical protein
MLPSPALFDVETAASLLRDGDGNVRAALICWGIVLSAFVVLRIPREVLLGCLIVAGATVGLAATVVDLTPERAAASPRTSEMAAARGPVAWPSQGPSVQPVEWTRPR